MNITNKTVLITGGGSGIGLEIAKSLIAKGNKVIITGRTEAKLKQAAQGVENLSIFAGDINKAEDITKLVTYLTQNGGLDVLINNAGQASAYNISADANAFDKAEAEIQTNYLAVIRLTEKLLPLLSQSAQAAIVNVTSIVVYAPNAYISTYSASKAALHSYTQSLRFTLAKTTGIKVFELFPPLVDTDFSKDIGGENGIKPSAVADQFIAGVENNDEEIHVGATADIYKLFLSSPQEAFKALNALRGNE
jgi:uncharacterized oxidoreductase